MFRLDAGLIYKKTQPLLVKTNELNNGIALRETNNGIIRKVTTFKKQALAQGTQCDPLQRAQAVHETLFPCARKRLIARK